MTSVADAYISEIAERLNCGLRTLTRKLDLIRRTWLDAGDG